jgi:putative transposase
LSNLGHEVARTTIANILKRHGIDPVPGRVQKTTWQEFLTQTQELLAAADFFTVEAWAQKGLQRFFVLFFIEISSRRVEIAGISAKGNGFWMAQIARNLRDTVDGMLNGKRYLIHDRDPLFTQEFLSALAEAGIKLVKLPSRSPNLKAHAERFVRSIKESCLKRRLLFGEDFLRTAIREFMVHYHRERNHQGIGNGLIIPDRRLARRRGSVQRHSRLSDCSITMTGPDEPHISFFGYYG